jgi:hypothetical protein
LIRKKRRRKQSANILTSPEKIEKLVLAAEERVKKESLNKNGKRLLKREKQAVK